MRYAHISVLHTKYDYFYMRSVKKSILPLFCLIILIMQTSTTIASELHVKSSRGFESARAIPGFPLVAILFGLIVLVFLRSYLIKRASEPDQTLPEEEPETVALKPKTIPVYFETDKGKIIKTICIGDFHKLSDIQKHSGLEDYLFWDAFSELLTTGEIVGGESRQYTIREDIRIQWLDYFEEDSMK